MCWPLSLPRKKSSQTTPGPIVSSNSGHDRPSHKSFHHNQTSYGSYSNWGQHASGHGIIYNINPQTTNSLDELEKRCSHSAAFNSSARFDSPRCAKSTRLRITQTIEEWINCDGDEAVPSSLFWLYGGAGVGKSAIAQSLSEIYQQKEQLAASFFFFRGDPSRNNGEQLIPTLVSHLVRTFEGIVPFVEATINENRDLFTKNYRFQILQLVIAPLLALRLEEALVNRPRLIVIDGLDECENPDIQCELLRVIACAIPHISYPLRFLVTSRPESHITDIFNHNHDFQAIPVQRYNLSDDLDADIDIRNFLEEEFVKICQVHRLKRHLPDVWPDRNAITALVERSSGHFIYASTVIKYIRSPKHRPDDRLEVILRLQPPQEGDRPYAQLDALYALIFAGVESQVRLEKLYLVLGVIYSGNVRICTIEEILEMKPGDLELHLDPILSLVSIDGDKVRILHKSLFDFLLDSDRSGQLPFALPRALEKRLSLTAAFDSATRFEPPRCGESTRFRTIRIIEEWINGDGDNASLFWLYGGAGVGKSAMATSLSEAFQDNEQLAASFFFFRTDPSRNNGDHLIPTLVSQLVRTFGATFPFTDASIRENPALFTKKYEVQLHELVTKPLLALKSKKTRALVTHPRLIVVDGLDECQNSDVQCELLRAIAQAIRRIPYPLRFLVTSRPEAHIVDLFSRDLDLKAIPVRRFNLSDDLDADRDIRVFLKQAFAEIHNHHMGLHLPDSWPDQNAITSLVERSSRHFIYPSTVLRYIQSPKHRPDDRLELILRLQPPQEGDRPYAQLDALYALIFSDVESRVQLEKICLVVGLVYFGNVRVCTIEEKLEMKPGELVDLLDPILSLVAIDDDDEVRMLHKSLVDFILDVGRSGHLPFDLAQAQKLATTSIS